MRSLRKAQKDGLLHNISMLDDITDCWNRLSDAQRKHYQALSSTLLVQERDFGNTMAHLEHFDLIVFPNAPVGTYDF